MEVNNLTKTDNEIKSEFAIQEDKKTNDQTNIVIGANSILFMPFATLITGDLTGYYIYVPIVICLLGMILNIALIWYLRNTKSKIAKESLKLSFVDFSIIDSFKKFAPYVLGIAWFVCLIVVLLQIFM